MRITNGKKKFKLIPQVLLLFALSVLVTGIVTFLTQRSLSDSAIRQQTEALASQVAEEVHAAIREYPASDWLLSYWYAHADTMEIEYDVEYGSGTETEAKCRILEEHCPGIQLRYVTERELETMDSEDQKLYAEVAYSWLITRLNQIKRAWHIDYLFCVATDETYQTQFFLLSAADPGATRGTNYEEVYPLGNVVTVGADQQEAMRSAKTNRSHLANAGDYVDYYTLLGQTQGHPVFIGMTYDLSGIRASSAAQAQKETRYAMLFQIFLCVICLLLIYRFVLQPLKKVQKNIRLYILLFQEYHLKYPSHGYRWLNVKIRLDTGLVLSDPYAHKCCKIAGIKSKAKHYKYKKPGDPTRVFPNLLLSEMQIDGPLQCVVSDMTAFHVKGVYYELTLYMDLWNNEIVSHALSAKRGDRMTYISGLEDLIELKKLLPDHRMILHSDQGSVYSSKSFNELLPMYGITRSMSRAGTPTDNAAMEAINGWVKAELFMDLHVTGDRPVQEEVDDYIVFFNELRPAYALHYLTPKQYRESYFSAAAV